MRAVAVFWQLADLVTFAMMLSVWGWQAEGNPLIAAVVSMVPDGDLPHVILALALIGLKLALILFVAVLADMLVARPRYRMAVLIVATAAGALGFFHNVPNT